MVHACINPRPAHKYVHTLPYAVCCRESFASGSALKARANSCGASTHGGLRMATLEMPTNAQQISTTQIRAVDRAAPHGVPPSLLSSSLCQPSWPPPSSRTSASRICSEKRRIPVARGTISGRRWYTLELPQLQWLPSLLEEDPKNANACYGPARGCIACGGFHSRCACFLFGAALHRKLDPHEDMRTLWT